MDWFSWFLVGICSMTGAALIYIVWDILDWRIGSREEEHIGY